MAYLSDLKFLNRGSSYMEWDGESTDRPLNEELEQDAAAERLAELESALEQDEHPLDHEAELETEEEEASPISEKRLKREIRAEAVRRLEEAARTEADSSWTGIGSDGNEITRICGVICRWTIRPFRNPN